MGRRCPWRASWPGRCGHRQVPVLVLVVPVVPVVPVAPVVPVVPVSRCPGPGLGAVPYRGARRHSRRCARLRATSRRTGRHRAASLRGHPCPCAPTPRLRVDWRSQPTPARTASGYPMSHNPTPSSERPTERLLNPPAYPFSTPRPPSPALASPALGMPAPASTPLALAAMLRMQCAVGAPPCRPAPGRRQCPHRPRRDVRLHHALPAMPAAAPPGLPLSVPSQPCHPQRPRRPSSGGRGVVGTAPRCSGAMLPLQTQTVCP